MAIINRLFENIDSFFAWFSLSVKQTTDSYCDLETAEDQTTLVAHDGSLASVIQIDGITHLLGTEEFQHLHDAIALSLQTNMKRPGHALQFFFSYDQEGIVNELNNILRPAEETAKRLELDLKDLFDERVRYLADYCGYEKAFVVLWTRPFILTKEQASKAMKEKLNRIRESQLPPMKYGQNLAASIPEIRDQHRSLVRSILQDFNGLNLTSKLLEVHEAVRAMRESVDPEFTDLEWRPVLPGDKIPPKEMQNIAGDISGLLLPSLGRQILPRDAENLNLRTCRIGDRIYATLFIDLFPQDIKPFTHLFNRVLQTNIPWRISYLIESDGLSSFKLKPLIANILSFASPTNRLIGDAAEMLRYIAVNTDDAVVKLRVALSTWASEKEYKSLRIRASELARAVEGWGTCEVSEVSGDAFDGVVSSMLGVSFSSVATASIAPLSDVVYLLPYTRPASPWKQGALLLRSPDGKPWPYQPGSTKQTTWIDLFFARPGSGKSVLSNTINLALCLAPGIQRLPRIAIIDIGPSSSGLISLLKEALPKSQRHFAAYHRLRMTPEYSINPFDTQLGSRYPSPQERAFLVNFLTLLATPLGAEKSYDGISDMSGLIVDELYKNLADDGNPRVYTAGIESVIDGIIKEIDFVKDEHTTWWEVTDALFVAGFIHEAILAQRYAMPLLPDSASMARSQPIEDLYGQVQAPTGEPLISCFSRLMSSAVREYPILSRITSFDLGDARIVSLDLDEVAKSGGDAADRQTAVMYMLARYVLARHYYLTEDNVSEMSSQYQAYHKVRVEEIKEDPKRLVYDEFHRTAKAQAVREQVIVDMREGRKWNVQIALISQSLDDFDSVMVEFATSVFVMDAGPAQTIKKCAEIFGLSETAQNALKTRVHGPREGGATFLAQFATKNGMNIQLLTSTIGPVELWAFSTTSEDMSLRNKLYKQLGPAEARRVLANLFPTGSVHQRIEDRMSSLAEGDTGMITEEQRNGMIDQLILDIMAAYSENANVQHLKGW